MFFWYAGSKTRMSTRGDGWPGREDDEDNDVEGEHKQSESGSSIKSSESHDRVLSCWSPNLTIASSVRTVSSLFYPAQRSWCCAMPSLLLPARPSLSPSYESFFFRFVSCFSTSSQRSATTLSAGFPKVTQRVCDIFPTLLLMLTWKIAHNQVRWGVYRAFLPFRI